MANNSVYKYLCTLLPLEAAWRLSYTPALMRSALHTASGYDLVPTQGETVLLARQSRIVCEINGHCARQMLQLIELLSSDAAMQHFALEVNCHGLAEFMLGRSLKWRNTPKLIGTERVPVGRPLPSPLPSAYQLLNGSGKVMHSVSVLGVGMQSNDVFVLDKLHSCGLHIETFAENVRSWTKHIVAPQEIRLRHPFATATQQRNAA